MKVTVGIPTYKRSRLLAQAIESVLAQTHQDFRIVVSDNASEDDTASVIASFDDPRIEYLCHPENVGALLNINGLIDRADTEALVLLLDDDLLYPEHLAATVAVLETHPRVGLVHSSCDLIDADGRVMKPDIDLVRAGAPLTVESTERFYERSMSTWMVHWSSALFRTEAIQQAGGLRAEDLPIDDAPMYFRIALDWDVAAIGRPLAALRIHEGALSSAVATHTRTSVIITSSTNETLFRQRLEATEVAPVAESTRRRWQRLAGDEAIANLASAADTGAVGWRASIASFARLVRIHPRMLLSPRTSRFVLGHLGGRQLRDVFARS
jgi:cellulose synthase/poly-beta-1,6-N-acetylglucosamine synthase-like glycosyltransferase